MSIKGKHSARHNLTFVPRDLESPSASQPPSPLCNPKSEYHTPWLYNYSRNSFGFRCSEFSGNADLVVLGCSHTYGVGMPIEYTWPAHASQLTGLKDYVNLAMPGSSIFFQVRLLANYIRQYSTPKVVLANFPDLNRYETVDDNGDLRHGSTLDVWFEDYSRTPAYSHFQSLQALNFLEAICKSNNIKLVWQFWTAVGDPLGNLNAVMGDLQKYFSYCVDLFDHTGWAISHEDFKYDKKNKVLEYCGYRSAVPCCEDLYNKSKECFHLAYDRYEVPSKYQNVYIEKDLLEKKLDSTIGSAPGMNAHLGAHSHWHWAKNLIENI
jgi:hypothetical protein